MSVFDGALVWLHDLPQCDGGSAPAIVARLQQAGVSGVLLKLWDGGNRYNQDADGSYTSALALRQALKAAGLVCIAWGYHYTLSPAEAQAVITACKAVDPDGAVIDEEQEVENLARPDLAAAAFVPLLTAALPGLPLGYSPIGSIRNHLRDPYRQLTDAGLVMLPQTYYAGFEWTPQQTVSEFYADVTTYQLAQQPIYPAYEDAPLAKVGSTLADVQAFCQLVQAQGATGISVWDYQNLDAAGWQRVAVAAQAFPMPKPAPDWHALYEAEQTKNAALTAALQQIQAAAQGALS